MLLLKKFCIQCNIRITTSNVRYDGVDNLNFLETDFA